MPETMAFSLTFDAQGAKSRPVSKGITLPKDTNLAKHTKQLEREAEEDEEIYDKFEVPTQALDMFWQARGSNRWLAALLLIASEA